jgi:hypothetical protein
MVDSYRTSNAQKTFLSEFESPKTLENKVRITQWTTVSLIEKGCDRVAERGFADS